MPMRNVVDILRPIVRQLAEDDGDQDNGAVRRECECVGMCRRTIFVSRPIRNYIYKHPERFLGSYYIAEGCASGPRPGDELVARYPDYSLYRHTPIESPIATESECPF